MSSTHVESYRHAIGLQEQERGVEEEGSCCDPDSDEGAPELILECQRVLQIGQVDAPAV